MLAGQVIVEPEPVSGFAEEDSATEETGQSAQERGGHFIWKLTEASYLTSLREPAKQMNA